MVDGIHFDKPNRLEYVSIINDCIFILRSCNNFEVVFARQVNSSVHTLTWTFFFTFFVLTFMFSLN